METLHLIDFLGRGALAFVILYAFYAACIFLWEKIKPMFGSTVSEDVKKMISSFESSVSATFYGLDARLKEVEKKGAATTSATIPANATAQVVPTVAAPTGPTAA